MDIIFAAHSGLRYLVLLAGIVAALYALVGWIRGRPLDRAGRVLGAVFNGLLDLQVLLGLVLLALRPFYGALIGHVAMMLLAVITAHVLTGMNRRRPEPERSFALQFAAAAVPLALIVGGILAIRETIL